MLEAILRRILHTPPPIPVALAPGAVAKVITEIIDVTPINATITTALADCVAIDMHTSGYNTLALTVKARYFATATQGIRIHVRTSPTNQAAGTHTAVFSALIMTDAAAHFVTGELIGLTINNVTSGHSAVITGNTETTVTVAAIADGWTTLDAYTIPGADYDNADWDVWNPAFAADAVLRQTKVYSTDPAYVKVLVENLDPLRVVTDVKVYSTVG